MHPVVDDEDAAVLDRVMILLAPVNEIDEFVPLYVALPETLKEEVISEDADTEVLAVSDDRYPALPILIYRASAVDIVRAESRLLKSSGLNTLVKYA